MLATALEYISNAFVAGAIGLALGVAFGTTIKDFVTGVPAELRSAASALVTDTQAKISAAKADVIAKVAPVAVKPVIPVPPAVAVPVAPPTSAPTAA